MPSLKDLRNRIDSVKSTRKITQAMKMVAASKLKKAQESAEKGRLYSDKMDNLILNILRNTERILDPLVLDKSEGSRYLLMAITADRGLCGGFNSAVIKAVKEKYIELKEKNKNIEIYCVGRKGYESLNAVYSNNIISFREANLGKCSFIEIDKIGKELIENFKNGQFDTCFIYYNFFNSVISQTVTEQMLIPYNPNRESVNETESENKVMFEFEPDEETVLSELLPKNVSVQLYRALLEASASEQGARMTAMDNATRNAGEMIDELTLNYNRQRQAMITKELIEIISGAEAL